MDNRMDNRMDNNLDPLDEVNVIDRQNLVTSFVMLVYNTLYNLGESFAGHLISMVSRGRENRRNKLRDGYIYYHSYGPTEWDSVLFDDSMSIRLKLLYTPDTCSILHTMKSESTAINDELNDAENEQIEEQRRAAAQFRTNNGIDDDVVSSASDYELYELLPSKRYFVKTESETKFSQTDKGVAAESRLTFGFAIDSSPESEPGDTKCELSVRTQSFLIIEYGRVILTSTTRVDERLVNDESDEIIKSHGVTPTICLVQTMDEDIAFSLADAIVTNYTASINIIAIALLLHFGSS